MFVVDDEDIEREGIIGLFNWSEMGIEIIGEAWNGRLALQMLENHQPDIIVTDIKMPVMSGLDFAVQIRQKYPEAKIVFISGYEDFEAARDAININVVAYLLKPINRAEFLKVIRLAVNSCMEEKFKTEEEAILRKQLEESLPLLREKFLRDMVLGLEQSDEKSIIEKAGFLGMRIARCQYVVLIVAIDNYSEFCSQRTQEEIYLDSLGILRSMEKIPEGEHKSFTARVTEGEFVRLTAFPKEVAEDSITEYVEAAAEKIIRMINDRYNVGVTLGISPSASGIEKIHHLYSQAKKAVSQKLFLGSNKALWYEEYEATGGAVLPAAARVAGQLEEAIRAADTGKVKSIVEGYFATLLAGNTVHREYVQSVCMELISSAIRILNEMNESIESILGKNVSPWLKLINMETIPDIKNWMTNCLTGITEYLFLQRQDKNGMIVQKIKDMIDARYGDDITIDDIAARVYMAPGYIRRIFKNRTGDTIQDHLVAVRIRKAAEFLKKPGSKVYEVAEKVGYDNISYFCSIFKKYYGVTPGEYKDGIKNN